MKCLNSFKVISRGREYLSQESEEAPFADLMQPILPGEIAFLSVAYVRPHNGTVDVEWEAKEKSETNSGKKVQFGEKEGRRTAE